MGASQQDMIDQLLQATTVSPQPSFMGLQAPPNPQQLQQLLSKLQQREFLQNQPPTPGPYGYLHDAGRQQMLSVGQQLGNQAAMAIQPPPGGIPGQGTNAPPQGGDQASQSAAPAPQGSPAAAQAQIQQALLNAKQIYAAQISKGVDPDQATLTTLKYLASAGVPGVDAKLAEAQTAALGNQFKKSEAAKDNAQAAMDTASVPQKDIENKSKQWKTTYTDPEGFYEIQTNGNGEAKRVELKPNMAAMLTAPPEQQAQIAKMISEYNMAPLTGAALRSAGGQAIMAQVQALNPNYDATQWDAKSTT